MDSAQDLLPDDMEDLSEHGEDTQLTEDCSPSDKSRTLPTIRAKTISLSCAKSPSTKYSLLWSSWKSKLPSHQYFEYSSDNGQCFCLFTMVACYTLRNLSHAQSLHDTPLYSRVLVYHLDPQTFISICQQWLFKKTLRLSELKTWTHWTLLDLIELFTHWYHVLYLEEKGDLFSDKLFSNLETVLT